MRSLKIFCIYISLGAYICICEFSHLYWCFENILQFCLEVFHREPSSTCKSTEFSYVQTLNVKEKFVRWILLPCFHMYYLAGAFIWILGPRKSSTFNSFYGLFMYLYNAIAEFVQAVYLFYAWQPCFQKRANPLILNGWLMQRIKFESKYLKARSNPLCRESYFSYCQINTSHFFCDIIKMTVTLRK